MVLGMRAEGVPEPWRIECTFSSLHCKWPAHDRVPNFKSSLIHCLSENLPLGSAFPSFRVQTSSVVANGSSIPIPGGARPCCVSCDPAIKPSKAFAPKQ